LGILASAVYSTSEDSPGKMKVQQPKEVSNMNDEKILGQWGRMRRAYLMEHQPATYSTMVMRGELFPHRY